MVEVILSSFLRSIFKCEVTVPNYDLYASGLNKIKPQLYLSLYWLFKQIYANYGADHITS